MNYNNLLGLLKSISIGICLIYWHTVTYANNCDLPANVVVSGEYITGQVTIELPSNNSTQLNLFVKNKTFETGQCAAMVYKTLGESWQSLYLDYANKGITSNNIQILADSISGGIFVTEEFGGCGYNGFAKTIVCGPYSYASKYYTAHENMHGWEFQFVSDATSGVQFYLAFAHFTNLFYRAQTTNPDSLSGDTWYLDYLNYGLQNEAEWGSEVFSDWLLGTSTNAVWPYIQAHQPDYVEYFNCLWTTDSSPLECSQAIEIPMEFASFDPTQSPINNATTIINGNEEIIFSQAQSQSIWNVCFAPFKQTASEEDYHTLQELIDHVAPGLPDNAAYYYNLMYADANHDNTIDWLCEYNGPGPLIGNGNYLWNAQNTVGTYTFVVSGKGADDYVEYKQDPFLTLPSMAYGAIAQPQFREWQGQYGSANGANTFTAHSESPWYPLFSSRIDQAVELSINANGRENHLAVSSGDNVRITITIDPKDLNSQSADWWIYAETPFGPYRYNLMTWVQAYTDIRTYHGPLFSIANYEILDMVLPDGEYHFHFSVDDNSDGIKDSTFASSVIVTIE